jgi:hypothetical protein
MRVGYLLKIYMIAENQGKFALSVGDFRGGEGCWGII